MRVYTNKTFRGGISDEEDKGIRGSFKFGRALDIHKKIDSLSCQQAMRMESGTTVTDLVLFMVPCSDGNSYHFGSSGRIYRRTPAGVWSLVFTDPAGRIRGAEEWKGNSAHTFLYWATDINLRRKLIPGAVGWTDVTEVGTNLLHSAAWHSMVVGAGRQGDLFICNRDRLAMVDFTHTATPEAVRIIPGNLTKCLEATDKDIIFGSVKASDAEEGYLWVWNTLLMAWRKRKRIPVKGVNALVISEIMIAQAGTDGEIFFSDLVRTQPIIAFPAGGRVNPGGVTTKGNLAIFGVFGGGNPGIYSYGRTRKNRVFAMNLDYLLSPATVDEIGAVKMVGKDLLASWRSGTTFGVDVVDLANKASAVFESLDFTGGDPFMEKIFEHIKVTMRPLPSGCSVRMRFRINKRGDWIAARLGDGTEVFNVVGETEAVFNVNEAGEIYEVRAELFPSGNLTPDILSINNYFTSREKF